MKKICLFAVTALFLTILSACNQVREDIVSEINVDDLKLIKNDALVHKDEVKEIKYKNVINNLSEEGNLKYGLNETLLESKYEKETDDLDEFGNHVIGKFEKVNFAKIENKKLFHVNYDEDNLYASNSIGYLISDEIGDYNITQHDAEAVLSDVHSFRYSLNWFMDLFDDVYLGGFPENEYKKVLHYDDSFNIICQSKYEVEGEFGFVYFYKADLLIDKEGRLVKGSFVNEQYEFDNWHGAEIPSPDSSFAYSVEVVYGEKENLNFNYHPYFISQIKDATFRSYSSKKDNQVCVNEMVTFSLEDYLGEKALDSLNYFIADVEDETIIGLKNGKYVGKKAGKTKVTLANAYNDVTFEKEVEVVHPELIGFRAWTSNHTQEITKKVGESDYIELAFSPEGAKHIAEVVIRDDSLDKVSLSEPYEVERNDCVYIVYDVTMLKSGVATIDVIPTEAPLAKETITFTIEEV